ncbi:transcriptional regulator, TetR family [Glycomyces sambucus]|uniref:Transcriptional regulator, TetR family n=1 Tax=Glycomyces sambucus TaxID=380244 RepID=A0A1G9FWJ0_9ACTN|nr:TetR/AcrR family transcriptional regulator [Glycomyces sambucus]SDK92705.1 transcriptional regulator, TetR family [Glycomyces sambucus]
MTAEAERTLRADAAHNAGRLLAAAREVFAELGPDAPLKAVAERAGVGAMTLYRRFPNKEALVRAALERSITDQLAPVAERALAAGDPGRGLVALMEATLELVDRERNLLAAATNSGVLTADVTAPVLAPIARLTQRAQAAGTLRGDVTADDMARIMGMLLNVLWGTEPGTGAWRRYLALLLDALRPDRAGDLPPLAAPCDHSPAADCLPG